MLDIHLAALNAIAADNVDDVGSETATRTALIGVLSWVLSLSPETQIRTDFVVMLNDAIRDGDLQIAFATLGYDSRCAASETNGVEPYTGSDFLLTLERHTP